METIGILVIVLLAFVGSTFGNERTDGCPFPDGEPRDPVLILQAVKCLVPGGGEGPNVDFLGRPNATDEARDLFQGYCGDLEPFLRCLDDLNDVWDKCHHDEDERKHFRLLRDVIDTTLEISCADKGETLVKIYEELQPNSETPDRHVGFLQFMQDCRLQVDFNLLNGDARIPDRVFTAYSRMRFLRRCFRDNGRDVFVSTHEIISLFGRIAQKMKCLHPVRGTFVSCSTLNEDGTGDRECPRRFADMEQINISQKLIDDGFQCFFAPPVDTIRSGDDPESRIEEYFVNYCRNLTAVKDCLVEVTSSARLCLVNATRHEIFEIFQEMLETSLEVACSGDVTPLTRIFFGEYGLASSYDDAGDGGAAVVVGHCLDVTVTKVKHVPDVETEDASTMSLRMYREVAALNECLARDVGEETIRDFGDNFLKKVMDKINCASFHGVVPCKSIVDKF